MKEDGNLVISTGTGVVTDEDLLGHTKALLADTSIKSSWNEIIDFRTATESQVTEEGLQKIIEADSGHLDKVGGSRVAIIVQEDDHVKLARLYETLAVENLIDVIVFCDIGTACTWLGVDSSEL